MQHTLLTPMLRVPDIERSIAFYRHVLGFEVGDSFTPPGRLLPSWVRLGVGGVELMLSTLGSTATGAEAMRIHGDTQLYLRTDAVLAVADRAKARGVACTGPVVRFYGIKEIELCDPDGYRLVVGEATSERPTPE